MLDLPVLATDPRRIYLRFTTSSSFVSWGIRRFTWSEFSHVEFVTPYGLLGAHLKGGVMLRPFGYDLKDKGHREGVGYVDIPSTVKRKEIMSFARSQVGRPYDLPFIFGFMFREDWHNDGHWGCSELVASAFEHGGLPLLNVGHRVNRVTPQNIYSSPLVHYVLNPC